MADSPRNKIATLPPFQPRSWEDLARGYADISSEMIQRFRRLDGDLAETKAAALVASSAAARVEGAVTKLENAVAILQVQIAPGGDVDKRQQAHSSHAIDVVADSIADRVVTELHSPRGGRGNLLKDAVVEIVKTTKGADKLAAYEDADKRARDRREKIVVGVAVAVISSTLAWLAGYAMHAVQQPKAATIQVRP